LLIAGAGPLVSFVVGAVAGLAAVLAGVVGFGDLMVVSLGWLAVVNVILGLFNLLPGAPLDGGRVLCAILWWVRGDRDAARISADRAGVVLGLLVGVGGLAQMLFTGDLSGLWLVLLGWFLVSAAIAESASVRLHAALKGLTVRDVMTPDPVCAYAGQPVEVFVAAVATGARHRALPVVDIDGRPVGVVHLEQVAGVPPAERARRRLGEVATPLPATALLKPGEPATSVARVLSRMIPLAVVVDAGHVVGVVSAADVDRAVEVAGLTTGGRAVVGQRPR
jgi:CBS domain-containing protein